MIDIRPLREDEIPEAKTLVPQNCAEPNWKFCTAIFQDGEVVGLIGIESRLVAEPWYMKKGFNGAAMIALGWLDGTMRAISATLGFKGFEFFVGNEQSEEWHKFIKERLPVNDGVEKPGRYYFRSFTDGQKQKSETSRS